ncbi:sodium:solute symporter family protein [Planctomycetes bacterium K23_9]|uniref:Sodium/proline symporter n=1 Tax=Stieleria marina TaxID=1930275 RepID=A0A517P308_9BACT|nr:Sodium/proline symporter [Planctomycetes bacterium K23_9]
MTQLIIIAIYLALLVAMGLSASRLFRGTADDYMFASHSIGPFLLLMSLFGTTMTAFALVGSTGKAYAVGAGVYGLLASASGIIHSLCFFLIGVPLWRLGNRHGYRTQIQFFRDRLDNNFIGLLLFPVLVFLVIGYLMVGVLGGGSVVQAVTEGAFSKMGWFKSYDYGVPSPIASAVICAVVLTYVFFGGMRGTAWANAFQTGLFMILGLVTFVVIANSIGGTSSFADNLQIASAQADASLIARDKIPKTVFFSFLLIPLSVGMFPHIFQHWLTARSAAAFKLPIVVHPIFIMIVWVPCVLLGVWASGPASGIADQLAAMDPHDRGNAVLGALVSTHAGPLLGGLLTAGILAAIMSSLDSQFLCLGTMFTEDILRSNSRHAQDEKKTVRHARGFVIAVVVATYLLSLVLPRSVFDLGLWSFAGFTGLFPLVFAAIYWRRLSAAGAICSAIATFASWGVLFYRSDFGGNPRYSFPESPVRAGDFTLIPPLHPVVTVFVISAFVIVVVSLLTKAPKESTLKKFF